MTIDKRKEEHAREQHTHSVGAAHYSQRDRILIAAKARIWGAISRVLTRPRTSPPRPPRRPPPAFASGPEPATNPVPDPAPVPAHGGLASPPPPPPPTRGCPRAGLAPTVPCAGQRACAPAGRIRIISIRSSIVIIQSSSRMVVKNSPHSSKPCDETNQRWVETITNDSFDSYILAVLVPRRPVTSHSFSCTY